MHRRISHYPPSATTQPTTTPTTNLKPHPPHSEDVFGERTADQSLFWDSLLLCFTRAEKGATSGQVGNGTDVMSDEAFFA